MNRARLTWITALVAAGFGIWLLLRPAPPVDAPGTSSIPGQVGGQSERADPAAPSNARRTPWTRPSAKAGDQPDLADAEELPPLTEAEEEEIAAIIGDESTSDTVATATLLNIVYNQQRSPGIRLEAMQHSLNLLPTEELPRFAPLIKDSTTPRPLVERLMMDITNNPSRKISLEMSLALLESGHDFIWDEVKDLVAFLLDVDADEDLQAIIAEARRELVEIDKEIEEIMAEEEGRTPPGADAGQ
jgi:hypothetical protein